ncbi:MAG: ABC transporter permease [Xanthobacteraceae bacterium]
MKHISRLGFAWYGRENTGLVLVLLFLVISVVLLIVIADANPSRALQGLFVGAFGDRYAVAETLVQSVPIAIVALGVAPALRAGIFPVGSEGQLAIGAVTATAMVFALRGTSASLALPAGCIAGIVGGMAWAFLPAILRARLHVNEILSTLLMNYLAANLVLWLLRTGLSTAEQVATPRSDRLPVEALIPKLVDGTRLHWGALAVILCACALAYWIRSVQGLGYDVFATHRDLAARLGIREDAAVMSTMLVSGAAAGLAGWLQVAGLQGTLYPSVAGGLGFTGVLVALLGGLRPLGILVASLVMALLVTGSDGLQTDTGVPASIAVVAQALLLLGAGLVFAARQRRARQSVPDRDIVPVGDAR